jgi:hypothetical protein
MSRVLMIEGRRALVVVRNPPLPPTLDKLLRTMLFTFRSPVKITGALADCAGDQQHRLFLMAEGSHVGLDRVKRDLRLFQCGDCEGVQVRDVTMDRLAGLPIGRLAPRRRDHILGWYSGARRSQRVYLG